MRFTHAVCQTAQSSCSISSVQISMGMLWRHLSFTRTPCMLKGNCTFKHFTQHHNYLCKWHLYSNQLSFKQSKKASTVNTANGRVWSWRTNPYATRSILSLGPLPTRIILWFYIVSTVLYFHVQGWCWPGFARVASAPSPCWVSSSLVALSIARTTKLLPLKPS